MAFCSKSPSCNLKPLFSGKGRSIHKIFVYKQNNRFNPVLFPLVFSITYFFLICNVYISIGTHPKFPNFISTR